MNLTFGKPILLLLLISAATGSYIALRPKLPRTNLVLLSFDEQHAVEFGEALAPAGRHSRPSLLEQFTQRTGLTASAEVQSSQAENIRLVSAFMSPDAATAAPDLCEIELGAVGKFFAAPVDQVGFLPLNDFLRQDELLGKFLPARLEPWSKIDPATGRRVYFGIPDDVHPMTITYRADLFAQAGIDPASARTWPEFVQLCREFQTYEQAQGSPERRAIELPLSNAEALAAMVLQRHVNLVDASDRVHLTEPKVLETVVFYALAASGPGAVGADPAPGPGGWTRSLQRGDVGAMLTADWRADELKRLAPALAGKVRMMPLPRFDPDDSPTSTSGGTMVGIPRAAPHPAESWALLRFLYLSPESEQARLMSGSEIIPAMPEMWTNPAYQAPDAYFCGQKIDELYIQLARQVPARTVTPYSAWAELALGLVQQRAEHFARINGETGLRSACAAWLAEAQAQVQRIIDFGKLPS